MKIIDIDYLKSVVDHMRDQGIGFESGLTDDEIWAVEAQYEFRFPPDLRLFLSFALPVSDRFPNWRKRDSEDIGERLAWPADSICFDIEHNDFWMDEWGKKPDNLAEAKTVARAKIAKAPFLIPIYSHRYLPAIPCLSGNPVVSVYQTDIIYYGLDLPDYFFAEFQVRNPYPEPTYPPRKIALWSALERLNG